MTWGLKTTIFASMALAGTLNLAHAAAAYNQSTRDAFVPSWEQNASPSPKPAAKVTPVASLVGDTAPVQPAAPAADPVADAQARLAATKLKPEFAANYLAVQAATGTPWQLLAAVHKIETNQSGDTTRSSSAGATGPMQFMPATFAHYAKDGDGDGVTNIHDFDDALLSAGNYLRAGGADKGQYSTALYHYNHSYAYVTNVMIIARSLGLK
jgi:membrane-bound lytic murein transglycosylase B